MVSKAYNLIWIPPTFPEDQNAAFIPPIPSKTVENILRIAEHNPEADVRLWIDSDRHTGAQIQHLHDATISSLRGNLRLQDFRKVPGYANDALYNTPDHAPNWRADQNSLIWAVVDSARILACLQGNYDQIYYSDADVTNLNINDKIIQGALSKHGIVMSEDPEKAQQKENRREIFWENRAWAFDKSRMGFFQEMYEYTLKVVKRDPPQNGIGPVAKSMRDLLSSENMALEEIAFVPQFDGTEALHPGVRYKLAEGKTMELHVPSKKYELPHASKPLTLFFSSGEDTMQLQNRLGAAGVIPPLYGYRYSTPFSINIGAEYAEQVLTYLQEGRGGERFRISAEELTDTLHAIHRLESEDSLSKGQQRSSQAGPMKETGMGILRAGQQPDKLDQTDITGQTGLLIPTHSHTVQSPKPPRTGL